MPLARVIAARPDVFNHNVEVVPRLYPVARRGSVFLRSARVLRNAKELGGDEVTTKSGLMVGLGETHEEMVETFGLLREHHVQVLTIGQYLRPSEQHLPIVRYWHPDEFAALERAAYALGFEHVAAGPLVRSSYHADQHVPQAARRASGRSPPARRVDPAARQRPARAAAARHDRADRGQRDRLPALDLAAAARSSAARATRRSSHYGAIPYEFTHLSSHCDARRRRVRADACSAAVSPACAARRRPSRRPGRPPSRRCSCTPTCCTSAATWCSWRVFGCTLEDTHRPAALPRLLPRSAGSPRSR